MTIKDNGGPAFPHEVIGDLGQTREIWEGMTLRDYFAAKAMAALIAKNGACHAADAYEMADSMLKVREAA